MFGYLGLMRLVWSWWVDVNFWHGVNMSLMIKYDFDKVVLFVDKKKKKSIDFTGVLSDFEIVIFVVC